MKSHHLASLCRLDILLKKSFNGFFLIGSHVHGAFIKGKEEKKKNLRRERKIDNKLVSVGVEECVVFKVLHWCNLEDCV